MTMQSANLGPPGSSIPEGAGAPVARPELLEWLATGRLTLLDANRRPIDRSAWNSLPAQVQAAAIADFGRVVRGGAKAAVLFLK